MTLGNRLGLIAVEIPPLVVLVIGLFLVMARRSRMQRGAAGLATIGLALLVMYQFGQAVWNLINYDVYTSLSVGTAQTVSWVVAVLLRLLLAVGLLLLVLGLLRTARPLGIPDTAGGSGQRGVFGPTGEHGFVGQRPGQGAFGPSGSFAQVGQPAPLPERRRRLLSGGSRGWAAMTSRP